MNLETLRPEQPSKAIQRRRVIPKAVRPIALRMVMEIATMIGASFPAALVGGHGGIESGSDPRSSSC